MFITRGPIQYNPLWLSGPRTLIPAGTECERATNQPGEVYWAKPWPGMTDDQRAYAESIGYRLEPAEVATA